MFNGHKASIAGNRGHDNIDAWQDRAGTYGHDRLKLNKREKLAVDLNKLLRMAAKEGDGGRCGALIKSGADVHKMGGSHRNTPLHYAARFGHLHCIHALLQGKADPNMQNGDGRTALHWAAANGTASAVDMLVKGGANQRVRNKDGMTALELASHFNNTQTMAALRRHANLPPDDAGHVERVGIWGGKDIPQAPAGRAHNKHLGHDECSVQRVGVWHNSWCHYDTVVTPNDRRHKYQDQPHFNHGRPLSLVVKHKAG